MGLIGFDPLDINFNHREKKGGDQRASDQADESEGLDPSQHRKEEEQRMDIGSGADKEGS